jgi:hypothetical protein
MCDIPSIIPFSSREVTKGDDSRDIIILYFISQLAILSSPNTFLA